MKCPKCYRRLKEESTACMCGWCLSAATAEPSITPCAFETCATNATIRLKEPQGWVNVCETHADQLSLAATKQWLAERGFAKQENESREEWLGRLKHFRLIASMKMAGRMPIREPGEDREEA